MATLVLTVIGDDRPGLVEELAAVIDRSGGSWSQSSMAHLASKFAGIVEVDVPDASADELAEALGRFDSSELQVGVHRAGEAIEEVAAPESTVIIELELVGQDRPGIVHEVARVLARAGVSIDELMTATSSAPMSGETLFEASALLTAPLGIDRAALAAALEAVADELMVDIDLGSEIA